MNHALAAVINTGSVDSRAKKWKNEEDEEEKEQKDVRVVCLKTAGATCQSSLPHISIKRRMPQSARWPKVCSQLKLRGFSSLFLYTLLHLFLFGAPLVYFTFDECQSWSCHKISAVFQLFHTGKQRDFEWTRIKSRKREWLLLSK